MLIDASTVMIKDDNQYGYKVGENKVMIINKEREELKSLYPVTNSSEHLFRSLFNGKTGISPINQINFLAKNFRFKCDNCSNLCGLSFYLEGEKSNEIDYLKNTIVICENCYKNNDIINSIQKSSLILGNIYNVINPRESKFKLLLFLFIRFIN